MKKKIILTLLLACPLSVHADDAPAIKNAGAAKINAAPILYRIGAGGITFQTPKAEAEKVLGAPTNRDTSVVSHYANGMWVVWNEEAPTTAYSMGAESGYSGELALPSPYNAVALNGVLKEPFTEADPLGLGFLRQLYRFHEGAPAGYDCVPDRSCWARTTPDNLSVLAIPRMNLLVKKGILIRIVLKSE